MREVAQRWLSDAGHEVVFIAESRQDKLPGLDLVLLDVANPGRAARRVAALRALHCVPVLVVSGHQRRAAANASDSLASNIGAAAILPKPYTREQLLAAVASACGSGSRS